MSQTLLNYCTCPFCVLGTVPDVCLKEEPQTVPIPCTYAQHQLLPHQHSIWDFLFNLVTWCHQAVLPHLATKSLLMLSVYSFLFVFMFQLTETETGRTCWPYGKSQLAKQIPAFASLSRDSHHNTVCNYHINKSWVFKTLTGKSLQLALWRQLHTLKLNVMSCKQVTIAKIFLHHCCSVSTCTKLYSTCTPLTEPNACTKFISNLVLHFPFGSIPSQIWLLTNSITDKYFPNKQNCLFQSTHMSVPPPPTPPPKNICSFLQVPSFSPCKSTHCPTIFKYKSLTTAES